MLKPILISTLLILATCLNVKSQVSIQDEQVKYGELTFTLGETSLDEVIKTFGTNFEVTDWEGYSYECRYDSEFVDNWSMLYDNFKNHHIKSIEVY